MAQNGTAAAEQVYERESRGEIRDGEWDFDALKNENYGRCDSMEREISSLCK